jgi:site-specific recombinase XerD
LALSLTHFGKHLDRISALADLDCKLNNKMARKTFASVIYFKRNLPIHYLQILLGHQDIRDTQHYLRIEDGDIVDEIMKWMTNGSNS